MIFLSNTASPWDIHDMNLSEIRLPRQLEADDPAGPPPAVQYLMRYKENFIAKVFRKFENQVMRSCRMEVVNGFLLSKESQSLKI